MPALLHALARNADHTVHFTQTTHLASLTRPLVTSGVLIYKPPSTLVMKQLKPRPVTYRIVGGEVYVDGRHGVSIERIPQVLAIVSGFEGLLSGNRALLMHDYNVSLQGSPQRWRLHLTPRLPVLARVVKDVVVRGHQGMPNEVRTTTPNGDYSVMRLSP